MGRYLTFFNQTKPYRALDGETPEQVYCDNLTTWLTAAKSEYREAPLKEWYMLSKHLMPPPPNLLIKTLQSLKTRGLLRTILRIVKYPFDPLIARHKEQMVFSHTNIEDRFTEIYKLNYWDHEESVSGSASTLFYTENLRKNLPDLFAKFSIKSVFDAPCGDFNWMRYVIKDYPIDYIGGDIVLPLITSHNEIYKNTNVQFIHIDLTKHRFPSANLMMCRDCLFHLSYEDTKAVLKNFVESNIEYLLTSTHINSINFSNKNIKTGGFRHIDLFSAPYNFPKNVLYRILDWREPELEDWREPEPIREMCLWSREQAIMCSFIDVRTKS